MRGAALGNWAECWASRAGEQQGELGPGQMLTLPGTWKILCTDGLHACESSLDRGAGVICHHFANPGGFTLSARHLQGWLFPHCYTLCECEGCSSLGRYGVVRVTPCELPPGGQSEATREHEVRTCCPASRDRKCMHGSLPGALLPSLVLFMLQRRAMAVVQTLTTHRDTPARTLARNVLCLSMYTQRAIHCRLDT